MSSTLAAPDNFHVLRERVRLKGRLVTRTALHLGAGKETEAAAMDMPVLKDAEGYPLIPGSSLKGVVRSTIESLLRAVDDRERGLWACDPLSKDGCGEHEQGRRSEVSFDGHCTACRLLGSHVLASHARFGDALLLERGPAPPVEVRDGVAIDRDLKTVSGVQKYDFEVVAPGAAFDLEIFVDNPEPWLMGLLVAGFDQVGDGFTAVGGFTSRGLGRVELEWTGLRRVRAKQALAGEPAEDLDGEAMQAAFEEWRSALSERAGGGA